MSAVKHANRRTIDIHDLPEDLQLPPGFVMASLEDQIRTAREDLHRWIANNAHRAERDRGRGSMHPMFYAAGLQARRSVIHTLLRLQNNLPIEGVP